MLVTLPDTLIVAGFKFPKIFPNTLPPVILPITTKLPLAILLVTLRLLITLPLIEIFAALSAPTLATPDVMMLPPVMLPGILAVAGLKLPTKFPDIFPPVIFPVALIYPDAVTLPRFKSVILTFPKMSPPTYKLPAIPTPPPTTSAPDVVLVLFVVDAMLTEFV